MKILSVAILMFITLPGFSQSNMLTVTQAVETALKNNGRIRSADFDWQSQKTLQRTSFDLPKTEVSLVYGQYNSYPKNDNNIAISQAIPFSAFGSQGALNRALAASKEIKKTVTENEIIYQVRQVYHQLAYATARQRLLLRQDSIYEGFLRSASSRYQAGETNLLEQTTAEVQRSEARILLSENEGGILKLKMQLVALLNAGELPDLSPNDLVPLPFEGIPDTTGYASNPALANTRQEIAVARAEKRWQASKLAPDLLVGIFSQTLIGGPVNDSGRPATRGDRFTGFQLGVSLPLWFVPHQARVRSAEFAKMAAERTYDDHRVTLQGQFRQAIQQLQTSKRNLDYYNSSAVPNSDRILKQAQTSFREGEIGYSEYLFGVRSAINILEGYLKTINDYNQTVIYIEYLTGNK